MASHSVHAWLANPCKSPLSGIPVDRKRWPNKLLFKSACFASMWRHVNWLHGVRIGLDTFGFSWTLRHSDGEQILNVNSQIDGFCVIRRTDVNSGEASHWISSETARGRLCWSSKCGNQRRNDRVEAGDGRLSRKQRPCDWETSSTALVWCCKKSKKKKLQMKLGELFHFQRSGTSMIKSKFYFRLKVFFLLTLRCLLKYCLAVISELHNHFKSR